LAAVHCESHWGPLCSKVWASCEWSASRWSRTLREHALSHPSLAKPSEGRFPPNPCASGGCATTQHPPTPPMVYGIHRSPVPSVTLPALPISLFLPPYLVCVRTLGEMCSFEAGLPLVCVSTCTCHIHMQRAFVHGKPRHGGLKDACCPLRWENSGEGDKGESGDM
jgi:hypothetical protein